MVRSDEDLFSAFVLRDELEPLAELYRRLTPGLLATAARRVRDPVAAEDLVQATFVTAIERRDTFDTSRPVEPWLRGILFNLCRRWRSCPAESRWTGQADLPSIPTAAGTQPLERLERAELVHRVREVMRDLPSHYAQVLEPLLLREQSIEQVAQATSTNVSTVRTRLWRGLERIRQRLHAEFAPLVGLVLAIEASSQPPRLPVMQPSRGWRRAAVLTAAALPLLLGAWLWFGGDGATIGPATSRSPSIARESALDFRSGTRVRVPSEPEHSAPSASLRGAVVRLRLRDPHSGLPIADTSVRLLRSARNQNLMQSAAEFALSAVTDQDGFAEFAEVPLGPAKFVFDDLNRRSAEFEVLPGLAVRDEAPAPTHWVVGTVTSSAGPVEGAAIWLSSSAGTGSWGYIAGRSDSDGAFRVPAYRAEAHVWAEATGWVRSAWQKTTPEIGAVPLALGPTPATVAGTVRTPVGPLVKATIGIYPLDGSDHPVVVTATDADGRFRADGLREGRYSIVASHPAWAPARREVSLVAGECLDDIVVLMEAGGCVVARVNGPPGEYRLACVPLVEASERRELGLRVRVVTGGVPGDLRAASVETGSFRCIVVGDDRRTLHEWSYPPLRAGETRVLDIDLSRKDQLRGRVVDSDPGIQLRVFGVDVGEPVDTVGSVVSARVAADGRFVLVGGSAAMDLHLQPILPNGEPASLPVLAASAVSPGSTVVLPYEARLRASAWIEGSTRGFADPDVGVFVAHDRYLQSLPGSVDPVRNRFRVGPLPAGSYSLLSSSPSVEVARVTLEPGQVVELGAPSVPGPRRVDWRFRGPQAAVDSVHTLRLRSLTGRLLLEQDGREPVRLRPGRYTLECLGSRCLPVWRPLVVPMGGAEEVWIDVESASPVEFRFPFDSLIDGIADLNLSVTDVDRGESFFWRLAREAEPEFRLHTGLQPGRYRMQVKGRFDREFVVEDAGRVLRLTETIKY